MRRGVYLFGRWRVAHLIVFFFSPVLWDACIMHVYRCAPSPLFPVRPLLRKSDTLWFKQTDGLSTEMVQLLGGEVLRNQMPPQHTRGECNFLLSLKKTKTDPAPLHCPLLLISTTTWIPFLSEDPRLRKLSLYSSEWCTGCTEDDRHPELFFFCYLFWEKIGRILWNMLKMWYEWVDWFWSGVNFVTIKWSKYVEIFGICGNSCTQAFIFLTERKKMQKHELTEKENMQEQNRQCKKPTNHPQQSDRFLKRSYISRDTQSWRISGLLGVCWTYLSGWGLQGLFRMELVWGAPRLWHTKGPWGPWHRWRRGQ